MQTSQPSDERMKQLQRMLAASPEDTFLLYGIGMEFKKAGDSAKAIEHFDRTLKIDPGYCYAYYQRGMVLESDGEEDAARETYRAGIAAAERKGDAHARSELQAALDMLG